MATEATLRHIDTDLWNIEAEVDHLPVLAETWNDLSDSNQVSYFLEWDNLMGMLKFLMQAYSAGDMTPPQKARYKALVSKLKKHKPIIDRLELSVPKILI